MSRNDQELAALAMDLKRVALGLNRNSKAMANRFRLEAMKRLNRINTDANKPYLRKVLNLCQSERGAENLLMYSTLIQNYVTKEFQG